MLLVKCPIYQTMLPMPFCLSNSTLQLPSMPPHQQYFWMSALHQTPILYGRLQLAGSNALTHSIDRNEYFDLPFIPHFSVIGLTPHGHFNLRVRRDDQRCLLSQNQQKSSHTKKKEGQNIPLVGRKSGTKKSYPCSFPPWYWD
jgi:hypothetical protein